MYSISYILVCLLPFVVFHQSCSQSDIASSLPFGRPDEILLFAEDNDQVSGNQKSLAQMKSFAGSIGVLTSEFNKTAEVSKRRVVSPAFMLNLYNALENKKSSDWSYEKKAIRKSDTIRSYSARLTDVIHHEHTSEVVQRYVFDVSVISKSEKLRLAELRIPILQQSKVSKKIRVTLYKLNEVECLHNASETCYRRDTVSSQKIKQDHLDENDGVVVFKVTKAVKRWLKSARGRHVIEVGIPDDLVDDIVIVHQEFVDTQAILVTYTYNKEEKTKEDKKKEKNAEEEVAKEEKTKEKSKKKDREERSTDASKARKIKKDRERKKELRKQKMKQQLEKKPVKKEEHPCKKMSLTVDFEKIGWGSWVIYPKKFDAYQCVGECKGAMSSLHNPNNHAIMQGMIHLGNEDRAPRPCCVPTKLAPLSMLYYEHGKIVVKEHENMIVEECGCR